MNYPTHDTNWATSAKGNDWRRINVKVLVVGKNKTGSYWAMIDGKFLINIFSTKLAAMNAANEVLMSKPVDKWSWE